ncbi:MAG: hypothetical protein DRP29_09680 [Thermodesulfobacteriota bacterium]|nr:MAG: hypothetical protein DRP29_09680 [Thermodesulfobacteriota bacterium]
MAKLIDIFNKSISKVRGFYPFSIKRFSFKGDPDHVTFWRKVHKGRWEPFTFEVLEHYLQKNSVFLDIGAWIGVVSLYAAKLCNKVYAIEPDFVAFRYLSWNIELNKAFNIIPLQFALSSKDKSLISMSVFNEKPGSSETSFIRKAKIDTLSIQVLSLSWETLINLIHPDSNKISLIKMDIEGAEFEIIPSMLDFLREFRVSLYVSFHATFLDDTKRKSEIEYILSLLSFYPKIYSKGFKLININKIKQEIFEENRAYLFSFFNF